MNHDTSIFPEPHLFRPERFLDAATGTIDTAPPDTHGMGHVTYGFGRRICVGFNFANQALFINFATLLWALDIRPVVDPSTGKELIPDPDACVDAGVVVYVFCFSFLRAPAPLGGAMFGAAGQPGARAAKQAADVDRLSPHRGPAPCQAKMVPRFPEVHSVLERELVHGAA